VAIAALYLPIQAAVFGVLGAALIQPI